MEAAGPPIVAKAPMNKRSVLIVLLLVVGEISALFFLDRLVYSAKSHEFVLLFKPWIHAVALSAFWVVLRVYGDQPTRTTANWLLNVVVCLSPVVAAELFPQYFWRGDLYPCALVLMVASVAGWLLTDHARFSAPIYLSVLGIEWELTRAFCMLFLKEWQVFWFLNTPLLLLVLALDTSPLRKHRQVTEAVFWLGLVGFGLLFVHQISTAFKGHSSLVDASLTVFAHASWSLLGVHTQRQTWTQFASVGFLLSGHRLVGMVDFATFASLLTAVVCFVGAFKLLQNKPQAQ